MTAHHSKPCLLLGRDHIKLDSGFAIDPVNEFGPVRGKQLRNRVRTYADLRPELVGAVEQLLDFVSV